MSLSCQDPTARPVVVVGGVAGSGKTTLGRALARALGAPLLDLDSLTNPLLDRLDHLIDGPHWNAAGPHRDEVRAARYAVVRSAVADCVAVGVSPVVVAPFTRELAGGPEWVELEAAAAPAPVVVIHVDGSPRLLARRRDARGADRDRHRPLELPTPSPAVPHRRLDASLTTQQQVFRVLSGLGVRGVVDHEHPIFRRTFDAVLFDLDGTLADSTASVHRSWDELTTEIGLDLGAQPLAHGMPAGASLAALLSPAEAASAARRLGELECSDVGDVVPTPGGIELLESLPDGARAIVTSGSPSVAGARMTAAGVPTPSVVVTSADVDTGKPDPEPYLLAARRLGVDVARCLVVEDAPAGVASARAAGCAVLAVGGTCSPDQLDADLYVDALDQLELTPRDGGYALAVRRSPAGSTSAAR